MTKVLLTGGAGFTGAYFIEHILAETDWEIYSLERLTAREDRLGVLSYSPRIHRIYHDFIAEIPDRILRNLSVDYIAHMGAEVQGRGSLENPALFVRANTLGTFHMLEAARVLKPKKFIYVSSVDAIGEAIGLTENATLYPSNPYGAAKAAGEMLALSYRNSFKVPVSIVRTMNIFGKRQGVDKFVPMVIQTILAGKSIPMHVGQDGIPGSRCYLPVQEFVKGLHWILNYEPSDTYHIVGPARSNKEIVQLIGRTLGVSYHISPIVPGPSHDMHRLVVDTKLPPEAYRRDTVDEELVSTVKWYGENRQWL